MLPRQLYELLPYIYVVTGILCAVAIDSTIVLISSILLIVTGVFVLIMRRNFRRALHQQNEQYQIAYGAGGVAHTEKRSGVDRRRRQGEQVVSDRRIAERRAAETAVEPA